jgi:hypothetical protein
VAAERQLGAPPGDAATERSADEFVQWSADLGADADLAQDSRMMVPVFYDLQRRQTKVWVLLGWSQRPVEIGFAHAPSADVTGPQEAQVEFGSTWRSIAYPVTAEVYVNEILDRDEFRRHCDTYRTRAAILANLK